MNSSEEIRMELQDAYRTLGYLVGVLACGLMWAMVWIVWTV